MNRLSMATLCSVALSCFLTLVGCDDQGQTPLGASGAKQIPRRSNFTTIPDETYRRILAQCLRDISYAKEFAQVFTNRYAHIVGGINARPREYALVMQAQLYGRYLATMQIQVNIDEERTQLIGHGNPRWVVFEVLLIRKLPSGNFQITSDARTRQYLTLEQWRKLVAAGGDLSVLGFKVVKDKPLLWFEEHWRSAENSLPPIF